MSKPVDHESFELLDQRDEEQILAEIKGQIITEMFYELTVGGKKVTGISWVGTKEISRKYGGISMGLPQVEDLGEFYAASVQATDKRNDVTLVGTALQPKNITLKTGEVKSDPFAYTKATSKAQRNAIRALIPEKYLIEMYQYFKDGKKNPEPKPEYREATVTVPVRPDGTTILQYLEDCGYKAEQFTVWEDEPMGIICIKPKRFMGDDKWKDEMRELGATYDRENRVYVVNM